MDAWGFECLQGRTKCKHGFSIDGFKSTNFEAGRQVSCETIKDLLRSSSPGQRENPSLGSATLKSHQEPCTKVGPRSV